MATKARAIAVAANSPAHTAIRWLFAAAALAAAMAPVGVSKAASSHDGNWKVTIITQAGNCDAAYSYAVKVENGQIRYGGDGSFEISGTVAEAGEVKVAIGRGDQHANASGKLSDNAGAGQWSGKSASTACSGRWEALREG
jgi:hypothetical protein